MDIMNNNRVNKRDVSAGQGGDRPLERVESDGIVVWHTDRLFRHRAIWKS